jgi:hypothetical protein
VIEVDGVGVGSVLIVNQRRLGGIGGIVIHIAVEFQIVDLQGFQLPNSAVVILPQRMLILLREVVCIFHPHSAGLVDQEAFPMPAAVALAANIPLCGLAQELNSILKAETGRYTFLTYDAAIQLADPQTACGQGVTDAENIHRLLRRLGNNYIQCGFCAAKHSEIGIDNLQGQLVLTGLSGSILVVPGEAFALLALDYNGIFIRIGCFNHTSVKQLESIAYNQVILIGQNNSDFFYHFIVLPMEIIRS